MIRRFVLCAALLVAFATPARAADTTGRLLEQLDHCDPREPSTLAPKLDVLLGLAGGRSAVELVSLIGGRRPCIGDVTTFGDGADELVFVGGLGKIDATGALLWVDRGYWRIAAVPIGHRSGTREVRWNGAAREFFAGIDSGGSAGTVGLLGVRLVGATATVTLNFLPGAELREMRLLDDDHLLIQGRLTTDPLLRWGSHPLWPYGAQWLFERQGEAFVQVSARQSRDPNYLMTGFVGALFDRDVNVMRRFATDDAIASALDLPQLDRRIDGLQLLAGKDFLEREHMSWSALPEDIRTTAPAGPVWGTFVNYDDHTRDRHEVRLRFDRSGDGWIITAVERTGPRRAAESALIP